ncbi:MAG: 4-(cytidine 5'-diphospho)-2-C-methyl-D-erythritol kinase [Candidatus Zixiibacteriota bacterium]|nr:MAG: 4-(cytidine 5'-diphospho)-2-C-methyl-D-erythritol kinase [candidate division Zixibacteria bacterium]
MDKISLKAPAKINLYLKVLGKREDGYHEIESLMQAIDLYDEISIEKSDILEVECDEPSLPSDDSNLALKAAVLLQRRAYFPGAKIVLKKNIPVGAGLGGGSSDAAFVIRGIGELYDINLSLEEKLELASVIGSDVPFFLSSGQAIISGRGEKISPLKLPLDYGIIVIAPPAASSTAEVYGSLKNHLTNRQDQILLKREMLSSSFYRMLKSFGNDLEETVFGDLPELEEIKKHLIRSGCINSLMTGSGSAVFGVFRSTKTEDFKLEEEIKQNYRVYFCRPILLPPF